MSQNLTFKWLGPYRILDAVKEKGTYLLKELAWLAHLQVILVPLKSLSVS